ncbi:putative sulfate exporter family transporter [Georgenia sp. TF02-10]|uniref:YeiH family protein n=1 Tax=Georgenia sp. TF02-10 TaxID=2917725 RepID=UPI001FA6D35F|nr:putative sulfate exporter family transporter [Georgenia sp. TF02-10]UNX55243.1 putative sulfate exporter family transporter [Georgenia sp. TF02-10]
MTQPPAARPTPEPAPQQEQRPARLVERGGFWAGVGLCAVVALVAMGIGGLVPVMGGPVVGILLGLLLGRVLGRRTSALGPGLAFTSKKVLQAAVVLLGFGLSLGEVLEVGVGSLPVMVGTIAVALAGAALLGRWLGVDQETRTLVGVGTGICGASAIATVSAVTGAGGTAISLAVTTIFVFNVLAAVLFPFLGHLLGMSQESFGLWAGTAINDTSSVVAAATVYGAAATSYAVVVKLSRTLLIVPISVWLAVRTHLAASRAARAGAAEAGGQPGGPAGAGAGAAGTATGPPTGRGRLPWRTLVPTFLVLFLLAAAVNSLGLVPDGAQAPIRWLTVLLTTMAMTAIGMLTPIDALRRSGWRPLALGGILWVAVALSSLGLQALTGTL